MASHMRWDPTALAARAFAELANPHLIAAAVRDESGACIDFEMLAGNRAARAVLDIDGDPVGTRLSASPHRDYISDLATILERVIESGEPFQAQDRPIVMDSEGHEGYFDFTCVSLGGDALCLSWHDVTEQHHAQESALSMEAAAIGMALVSGERVLLRVNDAMCQMLGYSREELEGKTVSDITHPDDVEIGLLGIRDLITGTRREFRQRKRYLARNGEVIWADLSAAVVRHPDGTFRHMVAQLVNVTAEVAAFEAMREAVSRFRSLAENASDIVAELDLRGRIRWVSPSIRSELGWDPDLLVGSGMVNLLDPADAERAREIGPRLVRGDDVGSVLLRFRAVDGATRVYDVAAHRVEEAGQPVGMVVGMHDVTEREQAFRALAESEETFRLIMRWAPIGKAIAGPDGRFTEVNPALARLLGYGEYELLGLRVEDFLPPECAPAWQEMIDALRSGPEDSARHVHCMRGRAGEVWVQHSISLLRTPAGAPHLYIHQFADQTEARQLQDELAERATHDDLTGLPNRMGLKARLLGRLNYAPQEPAEPTAVLFCDVDNLKQINDDHGHLVGDEVLTLVAQRIDGALRASDVVARFGGDEFVVVMDTDGDAGTLASIAERIRSVVAEPAVVAGAALSVSISIGATVAQAGDSPSDVLDRADQALYQAKRAGRNRVTVVVPQSP